MTVPVATYRVQLEPRFTLHDAARLVPGLHALGISHLYCSPYLSAARGSTHGYDQVDPRTISAELGGEAGYRALLDALAAHGMAHLADVVPNHMGILDPSNAWWMDVLENGPASLYAEHFDIDWRPAKATLEDRVLLPVLGSHYGATLERGELTLHREGGAFTVHYFEHRFPLSPSTWPPLLEQARGALSPEVPAEVAEELESIAAHARNLPPPGTRDGAGKRERAREKEVLKRRLAALCETGAVREAIDAAVGALNGTPGDPRSFDALDALLDRQPYRLSSWRVASEEINYRRFFDVNGLAAVRTESPAVFDALHGRLLEAFGRGELAGFRLDHTDGLYEPAAYFERLREAAAAAGGHEPYLVAEKILVGRETLPRAWAVAGTTGYDFAARLTGLFVDRASDSVLTRLYQRFTGDHLTFAEHATVARRAVMTSTLSSETHRLARLLERIASRDRRWRDFTFETLLTALVETIAAFPVYRTYVHPDGSREPSDEQHVNRAIRGARRSAPQLDASVLEFLRDALLLRLPRPPEAAHEAERVELAMRVQQLTGPVMAKGVEDTALFRSTRFLAACDVGADPERPATSADELHAHAQAQLADWPGGMTATSTHDSKRGEDVRARLAALSELAGELEPWLERWFELSAPFVTTGEEPAPDLPTQYALVQTLVGAWPLEPSEDFGERMDQHMRKLAREAKLRTSWVAPDDAYEQATSRLVAGVLGDGACRAHLEALVRRVEIAGASSALAMVVIRVAFPGVPDTYQGTERWHLRLTDPDNRTPIDPGWLEGALRTIDDAEPAALRDGFRDARIKLQVLRRALRLRQKLPALFREGDYRPLQAGEEVFAFQRSDGAHTVACLAVRAPVAVLRRGAQDGHWPIGELHGARDVELGGARWRDVLTGARHEGGRLPLAALLGQLPVALLVAE